MSHTSQDSCLILKNGAISAIWGMRPAWLLLGGDTALPGGSGPATPAASLAALPAARAAELGASGFRAVGAAPGASAFREDGHVPPLLSIRAWGVGRGRGRVGEALLRRPGQGGHGRLVSASFGGKEGSRRGPAWTSLSRAPSLCPRSLHDERPQALRDERPQPLRHRPHGAPRPHLHPGPHREGGPYRCR